MRLPAQTIIEIGQVTPGALVEPQDARPVLLPDFRQSVTVPGVIQPIDNVPSNTQRRSFVFGESLATEAAGATGLTICVLSAGFWRLQYNFVIQVTGFAGISRDDALTIDLGGTRHFIAFLDRFQNGSTIFNNQADFLLREDSNIDLLIGVTGVAEFVNCSASIVASKLL